MIIDFSLLFDHFTEQITLFQIMLEREAVQRQIFALLLILALSWLAPKLLDMMLRRYFRTFPEEGEQQGDSAAQQRQPDEVLTAEHPEAWRDRIIRWLRAVDFVLFPVLFLFLAQQTVLYFTENGWPGGLIEAVTPFFWVVLGYRLVAGFILAMLPTGQSEQFAAEVLRPVLWILVLMIVRSVFFSTLGLGEISLLRFADWTINLSDLIDGLIALLLAILLAGAVRRVLYNLMVRNEAEPDVASTVSTTLRYGIVSLGGLIGLGRLGVDLSALAWIGGGLSVGLGFGLQELFSNFVSGIVLVFERIVRPGDVIDVQGMRGSVTRVSMRATILRTADNSEIFVPNKELMTKPVIALTYSDRMARVALTIDVAYDADLELAERVLLETIQRHPLILSEPAPGVLTTSMEPYSIRFLAFGHVANFSDSFRVRSELYQMVRDAFQLHGITIPYPRQEVFVFSPNAGQSPS